MAAYFVGPSGSDLFTPSEATTSAKPWATIQHFWSVAAAGDTLVFLNGTYGQTACHLDTGNPNRVLNNITFKPAPGAHATLAPTAPGAMWLIKNQTGFTVLGDDSFGLIDVNSAQTFGPATDDLTAAAVRLLRNPALTGNATCPDFYIEGMKITKYFGFGFFIDANRSAGGIVNPWLHNIEVSGTANGIRYSGNVGGIIEDSRIINNQEMVKNDANVNNDWGAEGVALVYGSTGTLLRRCVIAGSYSRWGSNDYNVDGGAIELYGVKADQQTVISEIKAYNNHNFMETGTDLAQNSSWTNGNIAIRRCIVNGRDDYQQLPTNNNPNATPTTAIILARALNDSVIEHNVFDVDNGSPNNCGFRYQTGGTFSGTVNNVTIQDNIFYNRFSSPSINLQSNAPPPGFIERNNIMFYTFDYPFSSATSGGFVFKKATPSYTLGGLAALQAATTFGTGDLWGDINTNTANSDPMFVDPDNIVFENRNYALSAGSPAIGAAHDGSDIGAVDFAGPPPPPPPTLSYSTFYNIQDKFDRTVAPGGWGSANLGGPWTVDPIPAQFSVTNGVGGQMVIPGNGTQTRRALLATEPTRDFHFAAQFEFDVNASGGNSDFMVMLRAGDIDNDMYIAVARNSTVLGQMQLGIAKRVGIIQTSQVVPATVARESLGTSIAGVDFILEGQITRAYPTFIRLRLWRSTVPKPANWDLALNDSASPLAQRAGFVGVRGFTAVAGVATTITLKRFEIYSVIPGPTRHRYWWKT